MAKNLWEPGKSGNPNGRPKKEFVNVRAILESIEYVDNNGIPRKGVDPFRELALLAVKAKSEKVRREANADLAPYLAPKLKAIEHTGDAHAPLSINLVLTNNE